MAQVDHTGATTVLVVMQHQRRGRRAMHEHHPGATRNCLHRSQEEEQDTSVAWKGQVLKRESCEGVGVFGVS